jgi:putative ABC transport system permease protein
MLELLRTISLRHVAESRLRSLLVVFGIALGVATLVATIAVNRSILGAFGELVSRVAGKADLVLTNGEAGVPAELVEVIHGVEGVAHVAGTLEITTRLDGAGGPLLVLGVDFLGDHHFLPMTVKGGDDVVEDPFAFVNDPRAILVSEALAKELGASVGAEVKLLTPDGFTPFVVRGVLADEGVASSFGGRVALMFTEAAQLAFGRGERLDRVEIARAEGVDVSVLEARVRDALRGVGRVERPGSRTSHLEAVIAPIARGLAIGGALALAVGMFIIYNAVSVSVAQRQREIGTLRAIGVTRRMVMMLFATEAMVLSVAGGLVGVLLGRGLADLALAQATPSISRFYAPIRPAEPAITLELALLGILAGVVTTLVAAYFPARAAANVDPVEPLRGATRRLDGAHLPHRKLLALGALFLVPAVITARIPEVVTSFASLFFVLGAGLLAVPAVLRGLRSALAGPAERLLGLPGRLAVDNAERSLGRSALTVGALMTSVCSSVSVGSWGVSLERSMHEWLEHALPADFYITSGSFIADQQNVPFKPEALERLAGIDGVHLVYPVRIINVDVGDKRVQLVTAEMKHHYAELKRKGMSGRPPIDGPKEIDVAFLQTTPSVVLSENAAHRLHLGAGDTIELDTTTGKRRFVVHAVVVDYTSDLGVVLIDRRWYHEYWQDYLVDTIDIFVDEGADRAKIAATVRERLGGGATLFVVTAADVKDEIRNVIDQTLSVFRSTDLLALMVAILGVIGTMFAAVLDRVREIGVLRAIGATRAQVVRSVVAEAGFLGFVAALTGLVTGVPMGFVFVTVVGRVGTGWRIDYSFPFQGALTIALLVIVTAALAGLFPGRRAANLDVPEALSWE